MCCNCHQTMFSSAEEVIFTLRTQGMSQKGIATRVGCSQSTVSRILKKDFPAPVNNGGRPKKTSPQDDRALKRIAHSIRFKSTTSITHLWNETMTSPVSRSTTYRRLRFHGFSSRIPCTKPLLSCKQKKKRLTSTVCTEVFQVDGGGLEASHLLWWIEIRHGLWQQGTSCLVAKVWKAQGGLSEVLCQASGLRYGLGMRVIPRSWKFVLLVSQDDSQHGGVHRSARCLPASI